MKFTKVVIVVDKDVDVQDLREVVWKVGCGIDPRRDVIFSEGPLDALDHSSSTPEYGSKMGIDATRKWPEEGHAREWPDIVAMSDDVKKRVDDLWGKLGL